MDIKVPKRQCVACKARKEKSEFFRIVKCKESALFCNDRQLEGRSAYFCKNKDCIDVGKKRNLASKSLRMHVDVSVYDEMIKAL